MKFFSKFSVFVFLLLGTTGFTYSQDTDTISYWAPLRTEFTGVVNEGYDSVFTATILFDKEQFKDIKKLKFKLSNQEISRDLANGNGMKEKTATKEKEDKYHIYLGEYSNSNPITEWYLEDKQGRGRVLHLYFEENAAQVEEMLQ